MKKCSDQKNQNSSPFTDCARSFAFWQGLKESVDIFCIRAENSIHRCYRRTTVGRSGQRYKFPKGLAKTGSGAEPQPLKNLVYF